MALSTIAEIKQLLKVYDEAPQTARDQARVLFTVQGMTEFKWLLDKLDPGWRDRQVVVGGVFGKPVAKGSK